ncbi:MAG: hypothetical protein LBR47_02305 [Spirochaetaceae bacterium]|jgi:hypothetical protein|nr:hypothetical protein [Spirochaetaceae bacterium]
MIVSKNTHPERDLYYLGAKTIEVLNSSIQEEWDFLDLFAEVNTREKISLNLFSLVLDWLFILGVIRLNEKGEIRKCF